MHVPDGFINAPISATAGFISFSSIWITTKTANRFLADKLIAVAGMMSALIFVLQIINFPIAAGTSGHLLGGTLAVVVLGPSLGILCVSIVVIIQGLFFADGGLSALGINILNIAIITGLFSWFVIKYWTKMLGTKPITLLVGSFFAGIISVVMSSLGFVTEYALGGTVSVPIEKVVIAMVSTHFFIGIGEGLVTVLILSLLLKVRPDIIFMIKHKEEHNKSLPLIGVFILIILFSMLAIPFASSAPDGLEKVASDFGFNELSETPLFFEGYSLPGIGNRIISVVAGGFLGVLILVAIFSVYLRLIKKRQ